MLAPGVGCGLFGLRATLDGDGSVGSFLKRGERGVGVQDRGGEGEVSAVGGVDGDVNR